MILPASPGRINLAVCLMDQQRKVAFYIRVSTERQAKVEEGSLKNQEQMLRAELERRNLQHKGWGAFVET